MPYSKQKRSKKTAMYSVRKRCSRFINTQRHKSSCGPIAIANAIKWYGIETSYKAVLAWCAGVQAYCDEAGMFPWQMTYVLKTLKMCHRRKRDFTKEEFEEHLASGGAMILAYDTKKQGAHAVFVDAMNETHYRVWNHKSSSEPWVEKEHIRDAIERSRKKKHLYAFLFAKPPVQLTIKT